MFKKGKSIGLLRFGSHAISKNCLNFASLLDSQDHSDNCTQREIAAIGFMRMVLEYCTWCGEFIFIVEKEAFESLFSREMITSVLDYCQEHQKKLSLVWDEKAEIPEHQKIKLKGLLEKPWVMRCSFTDVEGRL